ncbi:MAG: hypothetical protein JXK93_11635 [Sphaerochaetaceae bacterium]|nr:hypothetical protein [Sphaerochaetaceae bacterium]
MKTMSVEEIKNSTIEHLANPDGSVLLDYLETKRVKNIVAQDSQEALLWYHEDEKQFIVELPDKDLSYKEYRSVDELLADGWVLIP